MSRLDLVGIWNLTRLSRELDRVFLARRNDWSATAGLRGWAGKSLCIELLNASTITADSSASLRNDKGGATG